MEIRVSYAHSAFPNYFRSESTPGVARISSRMETKAIASLKRHNTLSPWSPRPAPSPNPLFPLIERHWGADKARDAMQEILNQRCTPRKPAQGGADLSSVVNNEISHRSVAPVPPPPPPPPPTHAPPPVPIRHASLQKEMFARKSTNGREPPAETHQRVLPRGYSFDTDIDERSFGRVPSSSINATTTDVMSSEAGNSPSRRRSLGKGGLKGLMPNFSDFTLDSRPILERSFRGSVTGSRRKKESAGRWGWASWF